MFLMSGWVFQRKKFWIPVGDTFQKAYLEEWLRVDDDSTSDLGEHSIKATPPVNVSTMVRNSDNKDCTVKHKQLEEAPSAPRPTGQPDAPTWELLGPQGTPSFWERTEAPLPLPRRRCDFTHPKQLSPFPERLELPFPSGEILSGYEDVVSSGQDHYTTWVKMDPDVTEERHMVDVQQAVAEFQEASARRHDTSSQEYHFHNNVPHRSPAQKNDSASTTGIQGLDVAKKVQLKYKLQENGTLPPCRRRLIMWTTNSSQTGSMLPTTEVTRCVSTKTPSTLMLKSCPFTSTIPGANCLIK